MKKKIYVLLADGFEILEAMAPVDIMRRAGIEVVTLSLNDTLQVNSSHNVNVIADKLFDKFEDGDGIFVPGGYPGYENIYNCKEAMNLIKYYLDNNKMVAAICGAPSVLAKERIIDNRNITLHFATQEEAKKLCNVIDKPVVVDKNLITASGSGYSIEIGFAILEYFVPEAIPEVKKGMTL